MYRSKEKIHINFESLSFGVTSRSLRSWQEKIIKIVLLNVTKSCELSYKRNLITLLPDLVFVSFFSFHPKNKMDCIFEGSCNIYTNMLQCSMHFW